jgi:hypothetical protein
MTSRDRMTTSSAQYLHPGETVEAVIEAQTVSNHVIALTAGWAGVLTRFRFIVVTPQRILVLKAGPWGMTEKNARGVVGELPRSTRLGPASGLYHVIRANGEKLHVGRRFFKDIEAADAGASAQRPEFE